MGERDVPPADDLPTPGAGAQWLVWRRFVKYGAVWTPHTAAIPDDADIAGVDLAHGSRGRRESMKVQLQPKEFECSQLISCRWRPADKVAATSCRWLGRWWGAE